MLPLTQDKIRLLGASLKAGQYRSASLYLSAARRAHEELDLPITPAMQLAFTSAVRSCDRGKGPERRMEGIPLELLCSLAIRLGPWHPRRASPPARGAHRRFVVAHKRDRAVHGPRCDGSLLFVAEWLGGHVAPPSVENRSAGSRRRKDTWMLLQGRGALRQRVPCAHPVGASCLAPLPVARSTFTGGGAAFGTPTVSGCCWAAVREGQGR